MLDIGSFGQAGFVADIAATELPAAAVTGGKNFRVYGGGVQSIGGAKAVAAGVIGSPSFGVTALDDSANLVLLYGTQNKLGKWDGVRHFDITRTSGAYTATFRSAAFLSGIPVLTNGSDVPQALLNFSTHFVDLPNWPINTTAGVICSIGPILVACDITKAGQRFPTLVKWSTPADPGSVPASWDETDPTVDAGEVDVGGLRNPILAAVRLRESCLLYRRHSADIMQYVGGQFVFAFKNVLSNSGVLGPHCAVDVRGTHVLFGTDDLLMFDGGTAKSLGNQRLRRWLYSQIDITNYANSFVLFNDVLNEVWFCFPTSSSSVCNMALVWSIDTNSFGIVELPQLAFALTGPFEDSTLDTFDGAIGDFDSDSDVFDNAPLVAAGTNLIGLSEQNTSIVLLDSAAASSSMVLERVGLPVVSDGQRVDAGSVKLLRGVWPHLDAPSGTIVQISLGAQLTDSDAVAWQAPRDFVIGKQRKFDCVLSGRFFSYRVSYTGQALVRLNGMELDVVRSGTF